MRAKTGDRLHVHGRQVGDPDHVGTVLEARGADGAPPFLVRYPDGRETLVFPGPDAEVEAAEDPA